MISLNLSIDMNTFTKLFIFLFIMFPLFISCDHSVKTPIQGNHQLVNLCINIEDYDNIALNIPADVFYQQFSDSAPYLQIHTDENIFEALDVKVLDNRLIIEVKKDSVIKPSKLTIYTCSRNLREITITGSGNLFLKGEANAKDFNADIRGSGSLLADSLLCEKTGIRISGSGKAYLKGAGNQALFAVSGSGNIYAYDYLTQTLDCQISGSGSVQAVVIQKLEATLTGSGNLFYKGNPQSINKKIHGSGKIRIVN
jgi:hypothetical protein